MKIYLPLLFVFLASGCSNRAIYNNIQVEKRNHCLTLPRSQFEECMSSANKSFDEYTKERNKAINN